MNPPRDLTNKIFGRLTARWPVGKNLDLRQCWLCSCSCGKLRVVSGHSLSQGHCKSCGCLHREVATLLKTNFRHGKSRKTEGFLLYQAKYRARKNKLPCNIDITDIQIPITCPLLGITLFCGKGEGGFVPNSPTLDKIIPKLGYVKGNTRVISHRANQLKHDASLEEMKMLVENWGRLDG